MQHADIDGGTLQRSDLKDLIDQHGGPSRLVGVNMSGADLSRMALDHWVFEPCILVQASFLGSRLEGTQWKSCRAGQAIFEAANLLEAQFHSCDLNNTRWQRSKLSQASFAQCKLTGANFAGADLRGADLSGFRLNDAKLFKDAVISNAQASMLLSELGLSVA